MAFFQKAAVKIHRSPPKDGYGCLFSNLNSNALLGEILGSAGMIRQTALGSISQIQFSALGMSLGDGSSVFKDGGNDGVRLFFGNFAVGNDGSLDGDGGDIFIDALIGAGGDDGLGIGGIDRLHLGNGFVVQADQISALGGAQIGYSRGGSAGNDERSVDLAVLQSFGRIAEGQILGKNVSIGSAGSGVYFNALDFLAGYGMTEADIVPQ